jgi:hypothetical protein
MISDGRTPWCVGVADGASGVDWVEDLAIDSLGGEPPSSAGKAWLRFDGAAAASGFLRFGDLIATEGAVIGGPGAAVQRTNATAAAQMGGGPEPGCWLIHATAVERSGWGDSIRSDLRPIPLPLGDAPTTMRGRVYVVVVLRDRPEVRAMVRELLGTGIAAALVADAGGSEMLPLGPSAGTAWEAAGGSLRRALESALRSDRLWVDASDLMQRDIGEAAFPDSVRRIAEAAGPMAGGMIERELDALAELEAELQP